MQDLVFYAVFGFLLLVACVLAPTVLILDRKRKRQDKKGGRPTDRR